MAMTTPLEQWGIERELRKRIKETFEREGIEIPYPHQVIIREEA
jgi:small conductance mechanosensitive channel